VPTIPIVGLNLLVPLEEVGKDGVKNLDVRPFSGGIWTLNPNEVSPPDVDAQLVPQGGLAGVLVGAEGVPLLHLPLLGDPKVGSIDRHQAVVADVVDEPSIEIDLQFCEGRGKKRGQNFW